MDERRLIRILIMIITGLILSNIVNILLNKPSWQIDRFINVNVESNFTTWFSSMLLSVAAFFAYKCSLVARTKENGQKMWQLLSLGLLGMSCDEVAMIHEHLGQAVNKRFFHLKNLASQWVVVLGPFVLLIIIMFAIKIKKYLKYSKKAMKYLTLGSVIYIFGGFICEFTINFLNHDNLEWLWKIEILLEESFEMFGVLIIIKGLMEHYKFLLRRRVIGMHGEILQCNH